MSHAENNIPLFWWSETRLMGKEKENYGDLVSKYLVEKISGKKVEWLQPKKISWYKFPKKNYLGAGSIIHHCNKNSVVWGSGIIDQNQVIAEAEFLAVRGPQTRKFLLNLGYNCPEIYGDPALLLPEYFQPKVKKKYRIGIIPHYHDYSIAKKIFGGNKDYLVIDVMTSDIEQVTAEINLCQSTISSSLHGIIVSHTYGIPSVWVEFSDKIFGDGIKYKDYFESVELPFYDPKFIIEENISEIEELICSSSSLPKEDKIENLKKGLINSCPFISK